MNTFSWAFFLTGVVCVLGLVAGIIGGVFNRQRLEDLGMNVFFLGIAAVLVTGIPFVVTLMLQKGPTPTIRRLDAKQVQEGTRMVMVGKVRVPQHYVEYLLYTHGAVCRVDSDTYNAVDVGYRVSCRWEAR